MVLYLKNPIIKPNIKAVITFQIIISRILLPGKNSETLHITVSTYPKCQIPKSIEEEKYAVKSFFNKLISLKINPLKITSSKITVTIAL